MIPRPARFLSALVLTALPLAPLLAAGGPPHGRPGAGGGPFCDQERMERRAEHQAERLTRVLDLTPAQQVTLGGLQDELEVAIEPLAERMRTAHQQLQTLLDAASPDPAAAGTQVIAVDQARDAMGAAWERFETDFTAILTADQRAAYRVLQEARPDRGRSRGSHGRGGPGGHGGHGGPGGPPPQN